MTIYEQMLNQFSAQTDQQWHNIQIETAQQIMLAALSRTDFFARAAFYGGTCLRLFHQLQRYSEDMDFSLLKTDSTFHLENYFNAIQKEFKALGREVELKKKEKTELTKIESAFLKDTTEIYNLRFQTEKSIKIKIEVDTCPPLGFHIEQKLLLLPFSFYTPCFALPDLFAGKMHALLYRHWKQRVKGRDWYDFEWYIRHRVPLHFEHLQQRTLDFNGECINQETFIQKLQEHIANTDIKLVKKDVLPFIVNPQELDIWTTEYFLQLTKMITFSE